MFSNPPGSRLSEDDLIAVKQNAQQRLRVWRKNALGSISAWLISCAVIYPFVDGRVLSPRAEIAKDALLPLSLALLLIALYCALLLWGAWRALRDLE